MWVRACVCVYEYVFTMFFRAFKSNSPDRSLRVMNNWKSKSSLSLPLSLYSSSWEREWERERLVRRSPIFCFYYAAMDQWWETLMIRSFLFEKILQDFRSEKKFFFQKIFSEKANLSNSIKTTFTSLFPIQMSVVTGLMISWIVGSRRNKFYRHPNALA